MINRENEEKAVLVGIQLPGEGREDVLESVNELESLACTAGARVVGRVLQKKERPDRATFLGRGKALELAELCRDVESDMVISDRELSPAQTINLEKILGVRVIDRSRLILDIFACRAKTSEGKLQVELAQLNYLLPRLTGIGSELSRLGGGIGTRGPGETKLEVDRRRIRKRISDLKSDIEEIRKHRQVLRRGRKEVPFPLVSIVGYTNAGKSTLLKKLTGADVLVEDKLFATLDPTTRKVVLPNNQAVLLTDTVGFISSLPHHLVAAFRATLEEVMESDLLLHVIDISHPGALNQAETVKKVLNSLGAGNKPTITVYNKWDRLSGELPPLEEGDPVLISALTGRGLDELLERLTVAVERRRVKKRYFLPFSKAGILPLLFEKGLVTNQEHGPDGITVEVELEELLARRVEAELKTR
ncbi:MAG: GTPase HflX [Peptococcaceae bacterium BICA1-7]|nr:MAG: GTPase HflX [Peptococcaceae bacterium BICA1-7]HBV98151.1 GTPase HflX [Desulfotomaculum sp.]